MRSLSLLIICTVAWLAWLPAALFQKRARGDSGGISVLPAIPLFPVGGWLTALALDHISPNAGMYLIGGVHLGLIIVFTGSALLSAARIRATRKNPGEQAAGNGRALS